MPQMGTSKPSEFECQCVIKNREEGESQRDWLKRCMCMYHWMQTNYYQSKLSVQSFDTGE